ncbi:hypothetical protein DPMN_133529 [Dreissena polymorpha]|uniref:Uncharacterized protein n=1 Tax=Dreissena polymorpha TaxID=45954 RepID=A0A9D4G0B5_DREPO|nr:hypothetical protein DPMN_133529 [Dreissena polymorpha]
MECPHHVRDREDSTEMRKFNLTIIWISESRWTGSGQSVCRPFSSCCSLSRNKERSSGGRHVDQES